MKVYQINSKTSYVNDSVHWFGPFNNDKALEQFLFEDSTEEQWFFAVQNTIVLDLLKALKKVTDESRRVKEAA